MAWIFQLYRGVQFYWWGKREYAEETGVLGEIHRPVASHWQAVSHNVVSSTYHHERDSNITGYMQIYDHDITLLLFILYCMFCWSLFVLFYFFFWPLCCLFFFDIWILIIPLVSSNSSSVSKIYFWTMTNRIVTLYILTN